MYEGVRETDLSELSANVCQLHRSGALIATFETPIRELARLDDMLFVIVDPYRADQDPEYMGTNLFCLDLSGNRIWRADNLNDRPGWHPVYYWNLRIFDRASPKIYVAYDDRGWRYFDPETGVRLHLDPKYDWKNYPVAWKQLTEDQKRIDDAVFAKTKRFSPEPS